MNYNEDTLTSKERKNIDTSQFGLPEERKYPLTDAAHVKSAMAYFRYCDPSKKHKLAKRILSAAKKYDVKISEDSAVYKAAHEDADFMSTMNEEYYDNTRVVLEADNKDKSFTDMLDDDEDKKPTDTNDNQTQGDFSDITDAEDDVDTSFTTMADKGEEEDAINSGDKNFSDIGNEQPPAPDPEQPANEPTNVPANQEPPAAPDTTTDPGGEPAPDPDAAGDDPGNFSDMSDEADPSAGGEEGDFSDMADEGDPTGGGDDMGGDQTGNANQQPDPAAQAQPAGSGGDPELQELQQSAFSNLTEEQLRIRTNNIKQSFIDLYNDIVDLSDRMITINKNTDNINSVNFVANSLSELKQMVFDALTDSFNTRTLMENQVLLQRFIAHYGMLIHIIEKLPVKKQKED
nr:MAG TPA: hypothetical protein [Caudoviricetes sp.]